MAALPYMQLYVADYLADTAHLNAAQHGAYMLLLMNYWQRGKSFQASDERTLNVRLANVARMLNDEWEANKQLLSEFFVVSGNEWVHPRVERDLEAVNAKSTKARDAGKASGISRRQASKAETSERSANVEQTLNHTDTDTEQIQNRTDTELKIKILPADKRQATPKPQPDVRHTACREIVHACWRNRHAGDAAAPWDASEAKALDCLLKAKPDLTPERFRQLLYLRECSEDTNHSERPRRWLQNLTDYAGGPLDRFGKAITQTKAQSGATVGMYRGTERTDEPPADQVDFASWLRSEKHGPLDDGERAWLAEFEAKWSSEQPMQVNA